MSPRPIRFMSLPSHGVFRLDGVGGLRQTDTSEPEIETYFSRIRQDNIKNIDDLFSSKVRALERLPVWLRIGAYPALITGSIFIDRELRHDLRTREVHFSNLTIDQDGDFLRFDDNNEELPKIDPVYWPNISFGSLSSQPYVCIKHKIRKEITNIYFPCSEIARFYYIRSSMLARQAMVGETFGKPNMLSFPIHCTGYRKYEIEVPFTYTLNEAATAASVILSSRASSEWSGIRGQIIKNHINNSMPRGIEVYFPQSGMFDFILRGKWMKINKHWDFMVTEIVSSTINVPFDELTVVENAPIILTDKSISSGPSNLPSNEKVKKIRKPGKQIEIINKEPRRNVPLSIDLELSTLGGIDHEKVGKSRRILNIVGSRSGLRLKKPLTDGDDTSEGATGGGIGKNGPSKINLDTSGNETNYFADIDAINFFTASIKLMVENWLNEKKDSNVSATFVTGTKPQSLGMVKLANLSAYSGPMHWRYLTRRSNLERPRGVAIAQISTSLGIFYILEAQRRMSENYCTLTVCHEENARQLHPEEIDHLLDVIADRGLMRLNDDAAPDLIRYHSHHKENMDTRYFASRLRAAILDCVRQMRKRNGRTTGENHTIDVNLTPNDAK